MASEQAKQTPAQASGKAENSGKTPGPHGPPQDVAAVLARVYRPKKAVVTAGMPYANGPVHLGHIAGALLPPDIMSRFLGLLIGRDNVLFVCGTDEHGSTSELSALEAGLPTRDFVDLNHNKQKRTLERFSIGLDVYSGTSQPDCFPLHTAVCQDFITKLQANGLLDKRTSKQWYDPEKQRFLPDRFVRGTCPNPKCGDPNAYSDECPKCGHQHLPTDLLDPRSTISNATPELRDTVHLWLNMWDVSDTLREWLEGKQKTWRTSTLSDPLDRVRPALRFDRQHEDAYKGFKDTLPKHKSKYGAGGQVVLQFGNKVDLETARGVLGGHAVTTELVDEWAYRSITRDIAWGIPLPGDDPELAGKTLYVWPDSLIAPISFSQVALQKRGQDKERYRDFWCNSEARIYQFLGQDNVFFYVLMQGAMWLGTQANPHRLPRDGELQLTDVFSCFHLNVAGEKMSKSVGNFFTGDQLLDDKGYTTDQLRYYLALLGLPEKPSDFDFPKLDERNAFLAGPMNAAFERPISAAHSKFGGKVPAGKLVDKVEAATVKIVQRWVRAMEKAEYPSMLFEVENYARTINSLFAQYKPHDDRFPEEQRADALYTAFYVLKSLMIMLYPFVPDTMDRLRQSLRLPESVWSVDQLGTPMPAGHELGQKLPYFPSDASAEAAES